MPDTDRSILWLVLTDAADGRDDDYGAWLDRTHLPQVQAVPGIRSAQRFTRGDEREAAAGQVQRHLCVYELEGDAAEVLAEVGRRVQSGDIAVTDLLDRTSMAQSVWHASGPRVE